MASEAETPDLTRRQRLAKIGRSLTDAELDVLLCVADGIVHGQAVYGPLTPTTDERDFVEEALEEVRDALVYIGAQLERIRRVAR